MYQRRIEGISVHSNGEIRSNIKKRNRENVTGRRTVIRTIKMKNYYVKYTI
jgi:hypothetical protein